MIRMLEFISNDITNYWRQPIMSKVVQWGSLIYRWQKDASTSLYLVNTFNKLFKALAFVSKNDYSSVQFLKKPLQKPKTRALLVTKYPQLGTPKNTYIFQILFHKKKKMTLQM